MKKIGIVGGIAWPSTAEYYSEICRLSELSHRQSGMPEMVIESLDHDRAVAYIGSEGDDGSWTQFDQYHRAALQRLEASGAEFALIASNTSHHRFPEIVRGVGIPVISIFEAVARECARAGASQVLILGTATTMGSARFREVFAAHGIEAAGPKDPETRALTINLSDELQHGKDEAAAARISDIVERCCTQQFTAAPLVCLACTELPLAFSGLNALPVFQSHGIFYLNSSAIHIRAAFEYAVSR